MGKIKIYKLNIITIFFAVIFIFFTLNHTGGECYLCGFITFITTPPSIISLLFLVTRAGVYLEKLINIKDNFILLSQLYRAPPVS